MWKRHPFRDLRKSIDSWFLADNDPPLVRICGHVEQYIVVRHGANTWNLMTTGLADDYLRDLEPYPKSIRELAGPLQARFYCSPPRRPVL